MSTCRIIRPTVLLPVLCICRAGVEFIRTHRVHNPFQLLIALIPLLSPCPLVPPVLLAVLLHMCCLHLFLFLLHPCFIFLNLRNMILLLRHFLFRHKPRLVSPPLFARRRACILFLLRFACRTVFLFSFC